MSRLWSILFLLVPILGVYCFYWGITNNHWLPTDISEHGYVIDHLWWFILVLTGIVFVGTEVCLFWFMWKYDGKKNTAPVQYTHGSHTLEVVWTILPAATLLFIAIYQMSAWAEAKMLRPTHADGSQIQPVCEVTARQFEWRLRYPYTQQVDEHGHEYYGYGENDIYLVNDLRVPFNEEVVIDLKSQDVLHSFFLPNMRVKQDAVPGMKIPVWFKAKEVGQYDLVCAELCGWGHYKMKGRLTVMPREEFDAWLAQKSQEQEATQ